MFIVVVDSEQDDDDDDDGRELLASGIDEVCEYSSIDHFKYHTFNSHSTYLLSIANTLVVHSKHTTANVQFPSVVVRQVHAEMVMIRICK